MDCYILVRLGIPVAILSLLSYRLHLWLPGFSGFFFVDMVLRRRDLMLWGAVESRAKKRAMTAANGCMTTIRSVLGIPMGSLLRLVHPRMTVGALYNEMARLMEREAEPLIPLRVSALPAEGIVSLKVLLTESAGEVGQIIAALGSHIGLRSFVPLLDLEDRVRRVLRFLGVVHDALTGAVASPAGIARIRDSLSQELLALSASARRVLASCRTPEDDKSLFFTGAADLGQQPSP